MAARREIKSQLGVIREVAGRRKGAMRELAAWDIAEEIMRQDRDVLRGLARSDQTAPAPKKR